MIAQWINTQILDKSISVNVKILGLIITEQPETLWPIPCTPKNYCYSFGFWVWFKKPWDISSRFFLDD